MPHRLAEGSLQVTEGRSVIAPLRVAGLPEEIAALGTRWQRKLEFHLTVISADRVERTGREDAWALVRAVLSGRCAGPIEVGGELRVVSDPDRPGLRTVIAMADAGALPGLYAELSQAFGTPLEPPPAHVTLYSTDAAEGIGLDDEAQLAARAPALPESEQAALRDAMSFDEAFFDDDGLPAESVAPGALVLGRTDPVFGPEAMRALAYAAHVHAEQRRKGGRIPYLAHLLAVASLVAEEGGDETEVIGAFLHDTAENHGGEARLADVRRRFGSEVETIVRALSDTLVGAGEAKEPWRERKQRYLDGLRAETNPAVLRVSNADKVHNARSILNDQRLLGPELWQRFRASPLDQLWYYDELATIFEQKRPDAPLARQLTDIVSALGLELAGA